MKWSSRRVEFKHLRPQKTLLSLHAQNLGSNESETSLWEITNNTTVITALKYVVKGVFKEYLTVLQRAVQTDGFVSGKQEKEPLIKHTSTNTPDLFSSDLCLDAEQQVCRLSNTLKSFSQVKTFIQKVSLISQGGGATFWGTKRVRNKKKKNQI